MFKLVVLISLGVSWIGMCIEGTDTVDGEGQVKKNNVIEPIDADEASSSVEDQSTGRGNDEPTLALLLTYNGSNCNKKGKTSSKSKFETIHITSGGPKNRLPNNIIGERTSHSSLNGDTVPKNLGANALQHKYQELLDQLNTHAFNDESECLGINTNSCKIRNQQKGQYEQLGPIQLNEKYVSFLEPINNESEESLEDHHRYCDHQDDSAYHHLSHNDDTIDTTPSYVSNNPESKHSDESFEISDEFVTTKECDTNPVESVRTRKTHENYRREEMSHTTGPKPVKLRVTGSTKSHTDQINQVQTQKLQQPRSLKSPARIQPKSKHLPHRSHLKPLYIETESIESDSIETDSYEQYSDEEPLESLYEKQNRGHKYKSDKVFMHTLQANTNSVKRIRSTKKCRLDKISKLGWRTCCGFK